MSGSAKQVKFKTNSEPELKLPSQASSSAPTEEEDQLTTKDQVSDEEDNQEDYQGDGEDEQTPMTIHKGPDFRTVNVKGYEPR